jgi:hypothetical protein
MIVGLNRFREEKEKIKIECFKVEEGFRKESSISFSVSDRSAITERLRIASAA